MSVSFPSLRPAVTAIGTPNPYPGNTSPATVAVAPAEVPCTRIPSAVPNVPPNVVPAPSLAIAPIKCIPVE